MTSLEGIWITKGNENYDQYLAEFGKYVFFYL